MKKIAPALQELSKHNWNTTYLPSDGYEWLDETDTMWAAATAELRALLAVTRAAEKVRDRIAKMGLDEDGVWPEDVAVDKALTRLSRVSGKGEHR